MPLSTALAGTFLLLVATLVFTYYTVWVLVLPFVSPIEHAWLHALFLPPRFAIIIPVVLGVTLLALVAAFVGVVMWRKQRAATMAKKSKKT